MHDITNNKTKFHIPYLIKTDTMKLHIAGYYLSCQFAFTSFDVSI